MRTKSIAQEAGGWPNLIPNRKEVRLMPIIITLHIF